MYVVTVEFVIEPTQAAAFRDAIVANARSRAPRSRAAASSMSVARRAIRRRLPLRSLRDRAAFDTHLARRTFGRSTRRRARGSCARRCGPTCGSIRRHADAAIRARAFWAVPAWPFTMRQQRLGFLVLFSEAPARSLSRIAVRQAGTFVARVLPPAPGAALVNSRRSTSRPPGHQNNAPVGGLLHADRVIKSRIASADRLRRLTPERQLPRRPEVRNRSRSGVLNYGT